MQKLWNIFIELWFFKSKAVEFKLCFAELWDSRGNFQGFGRQVFFNDEIGKWNNYGSLFLFSEYLRIKGIWFILAQICDNVCVLH